MVHVFLSRLWVPPVLMAPFIFLMFFVVHSMVHNLLSIRRFTADNSCSVEFDSFWSYCKGFAFSASSAPM
jgi:hypothetical protein